ncbi:hypothetical protein [Desulfovibrio inopinatus]|uniref:hypothetical protein n=1 Tax=Desulfovibrio inopinatus TaxID=102109 RepID=UPI000426C805|nr:hypothetical protein [Desulfovibrio inopinatus]
MQFLVIAFFFLGIGAVIIWLIGYALYKFFIGPTHRLIDRSTAVIECKRQKNITKSEIARKFQSYEEKSKAQAAIKAAELFEISEKALRDANIAKQLEEMRLRAALIIHQADMESLERIVDRYQQTMQQIDQARHLNSREKAELFEEFRKLAS